jgi:thiol:disulfide interchange protein
MHISGNKGIREQDGALMNVGKTFKSIYAKPAYIAFNMAAALAYYYLISYLLAVQQKGIPVTAVPVYLIYFLAATSSVTLTIAVYSIGNTRRNQARISATSVSAASAFAGGIISGCSCQAAILFNALAFVAGAGEATLVNTIIGENAPIIFAAMIVLNLFLAVYYLERLSHPKCKLK